MKILSVSKAGRWGVLLEGDVEDFGEMLGAIACWIVLVVAKPYLSLVLGTEQQRCI
jgi:hypothetical protein